MKKPYIFSKLNAVIAVIMALFFNTVVASPSAKNKHVFDHWTPERMANAIPRDLVIDNRGLGYLRRADGSLEPYGHSKLAQLRATKPQPFARPPSDGGGDDTTEPSILYMNPANGATIGVDHTFVATITDDASGIKSVSFVITYPSGSTQSFSPSYVSTDTWEITLRGFSDGVWSWHVVAKDGAKKGGNTAIEVATFTVETGSGGGDGSGSGSGGTHVVTNSAWTDGGAVQTTVGRIYFEMPGNAKRKGPWSGYVCSGTVVNDNDKADRSIIITASHCVYDDTNKAFARNVLFIPNQDATSGSGTDRNCDNDPLGCWAPAFGVVDINWTSNIFPDNVEWDYAFYVVSDSGAHTGTGIHPDTDESLDNLEKATGSLNISFDPPDVDDNDPSATSPDFTYGLGYSYSDDPDFMYCADDMTQESVVNWWLPECGLSGGSSGGPWIQPMNEGTGPIISVNSWGFTGSPGMAGPKLSGSTASCVFETAKITPLDSVSTADGDAGEVYNANCP